MSARITTAEAAAHLGVSHDALMGPDPSNSASVAFEV